MSFHIKRRIQIYISSILFLNKSTLLLQCEQGSVANVDTTDAMQREWYHHGTMGWLEFWILCPFTRNLFNCSNNQSFKSCRSKEGEKTSPKGVSASKCEMGISLNLNLKQGIKVILYLHTFSSKEEILQN